MQAVTKPKLMVKKRVLWGEKKEENNINDNEEKGP